MLNKGRTLHKHVQTPFVKSPCFLCWGKTLYWKQLLCSLCLVQASIFFLISSVLTVEMAIFGRQNWLLLGSSDTQRIDYTWERFYLKVLKWENPPLMCIVWDDRTHLKLLGVCAHLTSEPSPAHVYIVLSPSLMSRGSGIFLYLRPVWPTEWVLRLHRKILSWNHQKKKLNQTKTMMQL